MIKPVRPVGPTELDRAECFAVSSDELESGFALAEAGWGYPQ
jgi:hypothetical protein